MSAAASFPLSPLLRRAFQALRLASIFAFTRWFATPRAATVWAATVWAATVWAATVWAATVWAATVWAAVLAAVVHLTPTPSQAQDGAAPRLRVGLPAYVGDIEPKSLAELSGLEASNREDGLLWAHNDQDAKLYALSTTGAHLATIKVEGTGNKDWEDIAAFQLNGRSYLLLADTGDNRSSRKDYDLVAVEEPRRSAKTGRFPKKARALWTTRFSFEDANPKRRPDCEAMAVDVRNRQILLLTKSKDDTQPTRLFQLPLEPHSRNKIVARDLGEIDSLLAATRKESFRRSQPTALDLDPTGRVAVVLTRCHAYAFVRHNGMTWSNALSQPPRVIRLPALPQAEALCFDRQSHSLFVSSERDKRERRAPLFRIPIQWQSDE